MVEKIKDLVVESSYVSKFYNSRRQPKGVVITSNKPSKTQISPLDCNSPQELLEKHGMYRDPSLYEKHPEKMYLDLTTLGDFQSNMQAVIDCKEKFMHLDPDVRNQFGNDIFKFVEHVRQPDFDITSVMNKKQKESYSKYLKNQEDKKAYDDYLKSDEYKRVLEESKIRAQYEKEQFESWLSARNLKNT